MADTLSPFVPLGAAPLQPAPEPLLAGHRELAIGAAVFLAGYEYYTRREIARI